ncbi:NADH dehydrogenase [ubiquinone] iron-sulfur protein 5 [Coccinella septempunctata]|uniref:NADH dehydrogenase [ubiquinone] iron-sulfur protein 5 n=1 Tax=Coccinella septempunctata TaxID=41139 RepID=UPI001D099C24|nr:NADH dehydrogenase [ubiquinone] iron-sulfur protein 5 [Coccinella septempunctata]
MASPLSPFFKSPLTDLTGVTISHQWFGRCQKQEEQALDCMEAYGLERGRRECRVLLDDYKECGMRAKQMARFRAMIAERDRQVKSGEKKIEELLVPPPNVESF